ncbi:MAG TPA: DNA repair protein RadC [Thermodesulfobacteriota bacterium]|nr:DNA repair protein RadC [Thermodesulfobacteriota bacterium]
MKSIKDLPTFNRPREKMAAQGPEALSDVELLSIILGSGVKGKNVIQVAQSILRTLAKQREKVELNSLLAIEGIGLAKACQIVASLEFARRRSSKDLLIIQKAKDVLPLIMPIADKKQEHFLCLSLNGANEVIGNRVVTVGLLNSSQVHPREVFADAISDRAAFVILAHNHPSGVLKPSSEDITINQQLIDAGKILGITVLDHIIITKKGYLSFKEAGLM